ncbi:DUF4360 domain-containing protein [Actinomadura vinacea]
MTISAAALALTAMAAAPASATGPKAPGPDKITVEIVTVNGSGCPLGTAAVAVSEDNTAFTVTYSDYLARTGGNSDPTAFRKNCQINLIVHVPQGFTYAISSADYRGFAQLQPGATGTQRAGYYFQGMPQTVQTTHTVKGHYADNWQFTDSTDVSQLVYKPCGEHRNFNINTELRVNLGTSDPTKTSFMAMDSTDGGIKTTYHFAWKTCP